MDKIKKVIPESVLKILRNSRTIYFKAVDSLKPYLNKINYCGISLYYTRGQGLINRIRFGSPDRIYERDLSEKIVSLFNEKKNPLFIDVGCNIGLISTYAIAHVKNLHVVAFEPGSHQSKLFGTTILANKLEDKVTLHTKALSDKTGVITFNIHKNPEDCGGDGIVNTHRGGETREVTIDSIKFDDFVLSNPLPSHDFCVMKLDTEGAELSVLIGAKEFICKNRPTIVLEITNLNIVNYNYKATDILKLLNEYGYSLKTLGSEIEVTASNAEELVLTIDSYIAYPNN
jgi:FkbM family methyltransferase